MKGSDYWSLLSGYWELFKDKQVFSSLWDAMIQVSAEYKSRRDYVRTPMPGMLPTGATHRWVEIVIDAGGVVGTKNPLPEGWAISGVPSISSMDMGSYYLDGEDYNYTNGIIPELPPGDYYAKELLVDYGLLNAYFNTGILDIDLSVYENPEWVMQACIFYMGQPRSVKNANNIISILAGRPFSKYYAKIDISGGKMICSYTPTIYENHEEFLTESGLYGYCYVDMENGEIYDGRYPALGPGEVMPLALCSKNNLIKTGDKYAPILERDVFDTSVVDSSTTYGEMEPDVVVGIISEGGVHDLVDGISIPITDVAPNPLAYGVTASFSPEYDDQVKPYMEAIWNDPIVVATGNVVWLGDTDIEVTDTGQHVFRVGEQVIITDGSSSYVRNVISGSYNYASESYLIKISETIPESLSYSIYIPRFQTCVCSVQWEDPGKLSAGASIPANSMAALRQIPISSEWLSTVENAISTGGDYEVGDVLSVFSGGEQTYHVVAEVISVGGAYTVVAYPLIPDRDINAPVYNMKKTPGANIVSLTQVGEEIPALNIENIVTYINIWLAGQTIHNGYGGEYINYNLDKIRTYDARYWDKIGREAKKKVKV